MNNENMTISEFAKLTGIKRDNLIFYDRAGILSPEHRGENGYRYYTRHQLGTAFLISSLREIGIGLKEIKAYADGRTPQRMIELFLQQKQQIHAEISKLQRLDGILQLYTDLAKEGLLTVEEDIQIVTKEKEPIFPGPLILPQQTEDEAIQSFYENAMELGMEISYPLGTIVSKETLLYDGQNAAQQFYFKLSQAADTYKPAGKYVTGCLRGNYEQSESIYQKLLSFIQDNDLVISGNAYEEYLFNEMSIKDPYLYLTRVEIMIQQ